MSHAHSNSLVTTPVQSDAEAQCACDIMVEAADWLAARGQALWKRDSLIPQKVRPSPEKGVLFLSRLDGVPIGAFLLLFEDPVIWPDAAPGEAFYIHKVALRRHAAGKGFGRRLIEHALAETSNARRPYLRLDCAPRPSLCGFYESAGFLRHSQDNIGGYHIVRYQQSAKSSS